jgi:hypothetical protein
LLTNDLQANGQSELFRDGVHVATYREPEELLDKIEYYLGKEAIRERIAAAGREEALARHTYRHRMGQILRLVEEGQSRGAVAVFASGGVSDVVDTIRATPCEGELAFLPSFEIVQLSKPCTLMWSLQGLSYAGRAGGAVRSQAEPYLLPITQLLHMTTYPLGLKTIMEDRGCHGRYNDSWVGRAEFWFG